MSELEEKSRSTQAALDSAYRYEISSVSRVCYHGGRSKKSLFYFVLSFYVRWYFFCMHICVPHSYEIATLKYRVLSPACLFSVIWVLAIFIDFPMSAFVIRQSKSNFKSYCTDVLAVILRFL